MRYYTRDELRRTATIARVFRGKEDHGIETVCVYLEGSGWGQGFGNLCMNDAAESSLFLAELCATFGLADAERLVGQRVIALYSESPYGSIEGLEDPKTGKRFTIRGWRLRHYPDHAPTPSEEARSRLTSSIAHLERRLTETKAELAALPELIDWETEGR